jgi:heat shock protein HslJ
MKTRSTLLCLGVAYAALALVAACATRGAPGPATPARNPPAVANASSAPLTDSQWRLLSIEGQTILNPPGAQQVYFLLQPRNTGVAGFTGCNRMFGRYALEGDSLKFDAMGATRMACLVESRLDIEQRFLAMFVRVTAWKITDRVLQLVDAQGKVLAEFEAQQANSQPAVPAG